MAVGVLEVRLIAVTAGGLHSVRGLVYALVDVVERSLVALIRMLVVIELSEHLHTKISICYDYNFQNKQIIHKKITNFKL